MKLRNLQFDPCKTWISRTGAKIEKNIIITTKRIGRNSKEIGCWRKIEGRNKQRRINFEGKFTEKAGKGKRGLNLKNCKSNIQKER
jgi:hypothetical protein